MKKFGKITLTIFFLLSLAVVFAVVCFFEFKKSDNKESENFASYDQQQNNISIEQNATFSNGSQEAENEEVKNVEVEIGSGKEVMLEVPFVSQAPTGNWNDDIFQNGCEETAAMMAMAWAKGEDTISSADAVEEIEKISKLEKNIFGHSVDTSADDVVRFVKKYYAYDNVQVQYDFGVQDVVDQLRAGRLVLVPTYGRALGNPNYTSPGPITHMLVIIGYDPVQNEFITNDPGTRKGKEYRYKQDVLMGAVWNYPSGKEHSEPPSEKSRRKAMIIISRSNDAQN